MWDIIVILCVAVAIFFLVRRYIGNASCSCGCHGCEKGKSTQQHTCSSLQSNVVNIDETKS